MADVFFRGKGWVARWYRRDGSRAKRATGTDKKKDAERIAAEWEAKDRNQETASGRLLESILGRAAAESRAGKLTPEKAEEMLLEICRLQNPDFRVVSLGAHLSAWASGQAGKVSKSTAKGYLETVEIVVELLGKSAKLPVADLTTAQAERLQRELAKGRKGATANYHFRNFRRALESAVTAKLTTWNPAKGISPLPESDSTERAPFDAAEVRALMDHKETSDEWRGVILFGAHTGLRIGDICQLGRGHVDGTRLVIRPAKTARSKKTIAIPLTPPLIAWIGERQGVFFPKLKAAKPGTRSTQFKRIMERAGIAKSVSLPGDVVASRSFHSLRHSFTSWLAAADIHADVRRKLTGHSSEGIHGRYTHHDEALDRAVLTLPHFG